MWLAYLLAEQGVHLVDPAFETDPTPQLTQESSAGAFE
jgi:hypothetical protein